MDSIKGIVYIYQNTINNKYYVGCTTESASRDRFASHRRASSGCRVFNRAVKKYGIDNFIHIIVEDNVPTLEQLHDMERFWIKELKSFKGNGYNLTSGGEVGKEFNHTQESRAKISMNNARYWAGVPVSEERKAIIRAALTGRKTSEDIKKKQAESLKKAYAEGRRVSALGKKVMCIETGEVFSDCVAACRHCNGSASGSGLRTAFSKQSDPVNYLGLTWTRNIE